MARERCLCLLCRQQGRGGSSVWGRLGLHFDAGQLLVCTGMSKGGREAV